MEKLLNFRKEHWVFCLELLPFPPSSPACSATRVKVSLKTSSFIVGLDLEGKVKDLCAMALSVKIANWIGNEWGKPTTLLAWGCSPTWGRWQTSGLYRNLPRNSWRRQNQRGSTHPWLNGRLCAHTRETQESSSSVVESKSWDRLENRLNFE